MLSTLLLSEEITTDVNTVTWIKDTVPQQGENTDALISQENMMDCSSAALLQ
jgi:hypothetical protein